MNKLVILLLILLLVIVPVVSASNQCSNMDKAVAASDASSNVNISSAHEHHKQILVVNDINTDCDCSDNIHCVGHASAYVAMSDLTVKSMGFSAVFLIYSSFLSPSETISPEIKPPRPFV
jgi:hypothetical protein